MTPKPCLSSSPPETSQPRACAEIIKLAAEAEIIQSQITTSLADLTSEFRDLQRIIGGVNGSPGFGEQIRSQRGLIKDIESEVANAKDIMIHARRAAFTVLGSIAVGVALYIFKQIMGAMP